MAKTASESGEEGGTLTFFEGKWHNGSIKVLAPNSQAMWLSTVVFDGARSIGGKTPDLDLHSARVVKSARILGMAPTMTGEEIEELSREGAARFGNDVDLYISPMFYAEDGFIVPEPDSTKFVLSIYVAPLPEPSGFTACRSSFRRPAKDMAPTEAKASCLYPNVARSVQEARDKGFNTGVALDPNGNVAEFSYTNLFMVKDGVVHTPAPNGTFLNGLTRQRIIQLLRADGIEVLERTIAYDELADAEEMFSTANYSKVMPCIKLDERNLNAGPMFERARRLYMEFAAES